MDLNKSAFKSRKESPKKFERTSSPQKTTRQVFQTTSGKVKSGNSETVHTRA